jgi:hypothetical protein
MVNRDFRPSREYDSLAACACSNIIDQYNLFVPGDAERMSSLNISPRTFQILTTPETPPAKPLIFETHSLRFSFQAIDSIGFPPGKAANVFRGAFGGIFRRIACVPACPGFAGAPARDCEYAPQCAYAHLFEPGSLGHGPSGLADWPRPFVFRAAHLDGRSILFGEHFEVELRLFQTGPPAQASIAAFTEAFAQLSSEGLGRPRGRARLIDVKGGAPDAVVVLNLQPDPSAPPRIVVEFLTPTELKSEGRIIAVPEFGTLFARVRDRIATLRALYSGGPPEVDFRGLIERAAANRIERCSLRHVEAARRSSRTHQSHPLGGFVGEVEYSGDFAESLPWLKAAEWTGVGRQTVWGKGEIRVREAQTVALQL